MPKPITETARPNPPISSPVAFMSYSWTSEAHKAQVREWADRLRGDSIDVKLDEYDLKEGDDIHAFMESMVTDKLVTHVLVVCDSGYVQKANARQKGAGAEAQIISPELYGKARQEKFIPLFCELDENGEPLLPVFMKGRKGVDFSTPEKVNQNWEQLVRLLHGKPLHQKPKLGKPPAYLSDNSLVPSGEISTKYAAFEHAMFSGNRAVALYRNDFITACMLHVDELRVREDPKEETPGEIVVEKYRNLKPVRDHLSKWMLVEGQVTPQSELTDIVRNVLEKLGELKLRAHEINAFRDYWFGGHAIFAYETFLAIVAALLKSGAYKTLHEIYTSRYFLPSLATQHGRPFVRFDHFYGHSEILNSILAEEGRKFYAPAAELIKRNADNADIPFAELQQADLLSFIMALILDVAWWYPQTLFYAKPYSVFPFFARAEDHTGFLKLAEITGISSADDLRNVFLDRKHKFAHSSFHAPDDNFWHQAKMEKLDTLR